MLTSFAAVVAHEPAVCVEVGLDALSLGKFFLALRIRPVSLSGSFSSGWFEVEG